MASPFNVGEAAPVQIGGGGLTLVNGRTFAISDPVGSVTRSGHGIVFEDLRIVSALEFFVDDVPVCGYQILAVGTPTPFSSVSVARLPLAADQADDADRPVVVQRRWVGRGYRHDLEVRHHSAGTRPTRITLRIGSDFAHIFDMKAGATGSGIRPLTVTPDGIELSASSAHASTRLAFDPQPSTIDAAANLIGWDLPASDQTSVAVSFTAEPVNDTRAAGILFGLGPVPADAIPIQRLTAWRDSVPSVTGADARLGPIADRCFEDLASLRIFDVDHLERFVIAAGAPWFMTLFGRDSLLTAWMTMPFAPEIASGVITTLAEFQGTNHDPESEEAPGRILHELRRHGGQGAFAARGRYYGTVDATALFVMVVSEAHRWAALDREAIARLWPSVVAAVGWLQHRLDAGPGGFVTYECLNPNGLRNQGWKDSWDGVNYADGRLASGPIALAEVQGYTFAALRGAAELARELDLPNLDPDVLDKQATELARRFNSAFWVSDGYFGMGVDRDGGIIDALTTNPGHALWCGIAEPEKASIYIDRLGSDDLWSGWGLRTLASSMGAYDPLSYHNGSVWPHDTAICLAGAARYGRWDVVDRLADGILDAAAGLGGRPPELFAGFARGDIPMPVAYPSSCSPQAWSSAGLLLVLRELIGLQAPESATGTPQLVRRAFTPLAQLEFAGVRVDDRRYRIGTLAGDATIDATEPGRRHRAAPDG